MIPLKGLGPLLSAVAETELELQDLWIMDRNFCVVEWLFQNSPEIRFFCRPSTREYTL